MIQYTHNMKPSEKNNPQTTSHQPHTFRTLTLWLIILIVLLVAFLLLMGNLPGPRLDTTDPAAQFLLDNTRPDITEDDIANAGTFLREETEPIRSDEILTIDAFFQSQPESNQ